MVTGTELTGAAQELRGRIAGEVILPDDGNYDEARASWNAMHDRRPAIIVRPRRTEDVVEALAFAREHDLPIAVRGGAHSVAGYGTAEDGLVIGHVLRGAGPMVRANTRTPPADGGHAGCADGHRGRRLAQHRRR